MNNNKLTGILAIDSKRGISAIFSETKCEYILKEGETGFPTVDFKNIPENFPFISSNLISTTFIEKDGELKGVMVNDNSINFIPGFEYLQFFKKDFLFILYIM